MAISFCKKCKNILPPENSEKNLIIVCPNCRTEQKRKSFLISKESIKKDVERGKGAREKINPYANYQHICKKCGYDKAHVMDMGARYCDEDTLILLRCGKCGASERVGRKTT